MNNIPIDKIPPRGIVLAYFGDTELFEPYTVSDGKIICIGSGIFEKQTPDECHFFDADEEFRLIRRRSRNDVVHIHLRRVDEENADPDLIYVQNVLVKTEHSIRDGIPKTLRIINRFAYTENDTLVLKNYRISYEKAGIKND